ncbi:hypothetical protein RJT34_04279 [Clitoria ternatea]|uniref:Leucine-rich repeat-containing N-terminal plant-type domain-containing protein n=1 Tax=Clitoria ternatea TaxID=43366 RepID=A0AAN9KLB0_CLITE
MFSSSLQMVTILLWSLSAITLSSGTSHNKMSVLCNQNDQHALSNFKQSIKDPSNRFFSWSVEEDCCNWSGVVCNNITGRITELHLPCTFTDFHDHENVASKCLGGEINFSHLFQLEFLSYLDLSWNDFVAIHFESIHAPTKNHSPSNFSNLLYLDLSENFNLHMDNLRWVSRFSSLKYLNLSSLQLYGETLWLQRLTMLPSLTELKLEGCQLNGINPSLGYVNFTSLSVLDISDNLFGSEIPKWLFNLSSKISYLDLSNSDFRGKIPATMLNFQHLKSLILSGNKLDGPIPEWMEQFRYLEQLDLSRNNLSGPILATIGNLSSLTFLDISSNRLNGDLPTSLGQLSKLETLWIGDNSLSGNLYEQNFIKLYSLKSLRLDSTSFAFDFGTNWVPPFQLDDISMRKCKVGPQFPLWLYTQRSLNYLDISSSGLSFKVHDKFYGFITQIEYLFLSNNSISGDISNTLITSTSIDLNSNNFTGRLPRLSSKVVFFNIANNNFSGPIYPTLCKNVTGKHKLAVLDVSHNLLSGEFPDCWTHWPSLLHVNLEGNNLYGQMSESLGTLTKLESLRLRHNFLSGAIPPSLKQCNLWYLDLSFNDFTGNVPSFVSRSKNMAFLLRSNKFSGSIPTQICEFSNLFALDLADNRLSGPIPHCLNNITAMVTNNVYDSSLFIEYYYSWDLAVFLVTSYLQDLPLFVKSQESNYWNLFSLVRIVDLSSNELSGCIPPELFGLITLQSLNLSHNRLAGKIPTGIGHMKFLESLDLSGNLLSGEIPQSISNLSFLNHLNLSHNNLHGRIPLGTQLQSFEASAYTGNPDLCGSPLPKNCTLEEKKHNGPMESKDNDFTNSFRTGIGIGFASAFWVVLGTLFIKKWRHVYFQILDNLYAIVMVKIDHFL